MTMTDADRAAAQLAELRQRQQANQQAKAAETLAMLTTKFAKPSRKNARSEQATRSNNGWA